MGLSTKHKIARQKRSEDEERLHQFNVTFKEVVPFHRVIRDAIEDGVCYILARHGMSLSYGVKGIDGAYTLTHYSEIPQHWKRWFAKALDAHRIVVVPGAGKTPDTIAAGRQRLDVASELSNHT
jgi:hypothetical protein